MSSIISADYVTWTFKSLKKYDEVPGRVFFSFSFEVNERRHPPKRIRCIYFLLMLMLNCCCCVVPYAFSFLFDGFVFFSFRDFCKRRLDLCAYFPVGLFGCWLLVAVVVAVVTILCWRLSWTRPEAACKLSSFSASPLFSSFIPFWPFSSSSSSSFPFCFFGFSLDGLGHQTTHAHFFFFFFFS